MNAKLLGIKVNPPFDDFKGSTHLHYGNEEPGVEGMACNTVSVGRESGITLPQGLKPGMIINLDFALMRSGKAKLVAVTIADAPAASGNFKITTKQSE